MLNELFKLINRVVPLTEDDKELCRQQFDPILVPKNRIVEIEGKIPKHLYFIISGFMRQFHYNNNGDEITTHINCPPGFITSYFHFINETKSDENVECVTDCELLRITKSGLTTLTQSSPALKDFSIWVQQQSIVYNETRTKDLATLDAEQRYRKLLNNYPSMLHHVPLQYIASFLGMNAKSLSRIRKQITK